MMDARTQLDRDGYSHIPSFLSSDLIHRYNARLTQVMQDCAQAPVQHVAFCGAQALFRVNELLRYFGAHTLYILGMPALQRLTQFLCEGEAICMYESLLVRSAANASRVEWHRDMNHQQNGRIFTLGLYLDAAVSQEDALQVLPEHHLSGVPISNLTPLLAGEKITPTKLPVSAGDLLIHDVRLPHASAPITSGRIRKTLYFEFRPLRLLRNANPEWLAERQRLNDIAQAVYARLEDKRKTEWTLTQSEADWVEDLYQQRQILEGAEYASDSDAQVSFRKPPVKKEGRQSPPESTTPPSQ
ncbi:phytanoyl-CoA deoxygenase family protein [Hahella chejuensis KCTC 2396]|uniref:Phytanoyl-CoA deoxygenase family protein n=1 Tax=Hahella chejuensis (strain KCTC 2396) TaxID=349521 RepID=Q2SI28_HAHCH|nr:phytanoyl-CoA dioxygenase family protein [Hahella chejuensis]ABC29696.1 phytanoyl-CoA deoxygenase family protein [Hahella chejuensis KCTC 2396]